MRYLGLILFIISDGHPFLAPTPAVKSTSAACAKPYGISRCLLFAYEENPQFLVRAVPASPWQPAGYPDGDLPSFLFADRRETCRFIAFFILPSLKKLDFQSSLLEKHSSSSSVTYTQLGRSAGARSLIRQREQWGETIHVLSRRLS